MDIFISWSGERSRAIAAALRDWLPKILSSSKPWMSQTDIMKGTRWDPEISTYLEKASAGIFCLTPSNLNSKSILYEAGAISKNVKDGSRVYTLLADIEPADLDWPLAQFQATSLRQDDIRKMVADINRVLATTGEGFLQDEVLVEAFSVWWPKLEEKIKLIPQDSQSFVPKRTEKAILEEILEHVRDQARSESRIEDLTARFERARFEEEVSRKDFSGQLETLRAETRNLISARLRSPVDLGPNNMSVMQFLLPDAQMTAVRALEGAGHHTASALLSAGKWSLKNGEINVESSIKKTLLGLTFNREAQKLLEDAVHAVGFNGPVKVIPLSSELKSSSQVPLKETDPF